MAVVCFDSSAFVKLLVEEAGSDVAARLWDEADAVVASRLALPVVRAALAAARRDARLDPRAERRALRDWEEYWSATRVVELTVTVATTAADLAAEFVLGGADAVHLASAVVMAGRPADPGRLGPALAHRSPAGRRGGGTRKALGTGAQLRLFVQPRKRMGGTRRARELSPMIL